MRLRKQAFPVILLAVIYTMGILGVFTSYYTVYHRQAFQSHVKEIHEGNLEKLYFTKQDFNSLQWMEEETEFEWQGKMYDVSKISKTKDGYLIVCEHDSFEEMLLAFADLTKGSKEPQGQKKGNPQPQFFALALELTPTGIAMSDLKSFNNFESLYHSIHPEISSPPPKFSLL